jgi:hypothetical protein
LPRPFSPERRAAGDINSHSRRYQHAETLALHHEHRPPAPAHRSGSESIECAIKKYFPGRLGENIPPW